MTPQDPAGPATPCIRLVPATLLPLSSAAAVLLAACGGGGGPAPPVEDPNDDPKPFSATSLAPVARPLTDSERRHFLTRTGFGAHPEEIFDLEEIGLDNKVEDVLIFRREHIVETQALAEIRVSTHPRTDELVAYWLHLMTRTRNPFREACALFWHDHFAVSQDKLDAASRHFMLDHIQLLRTRSTGGLRDLLWGLLSDPATLVWLDATDSIAEAPNENLAREFWELLSLGRDGGYTERDVEESARALTGFRLDYDPRSNLSSVVFDPERHDAGPKVVFGRAGNFGPREIVELTIRHRPAAEHVCGALFAWLCYPDPPDAVVDRLAAVMRDNDLRLKPVLRTILRSEAFFSARSMRPRIKSPLEYLVGFVRTTRMEIPFDDMRRLVAQMGHEPTRPPNVGGFPDGVEWLSAESMLQRQNAIVAAIDAREHQLHTGFDVQDLLPPIGRRSASAVVDALVRRLGVKADAAELELYLKYLDTRAHDLGEDGLTFRNSPFDATDPLQREERVRGLCYILAQHPSYHLR